MKKKIEFTFLAVIMLLLIVACASALQIDTSFRTKSGKNVAIIVTKTSGYLTVSAVIDGKEYECGGLHSGDVKSMSIVAVEDVAVKLRYGDKVFECVKLTQLNR